MTTEKKIKKRINTLQMLKGESITEIRITEKEAQELGDIDNIDGVKLIYPKDLLKKDCFAYIDNNGHKSCYALKELYCSKGQCRFYRNDITKAQLRTSMNLYSKGDTDEQRGIN